MRLVISVAATVLLSAFGVLPAVAAPAAAPTLDSIVALNNCSASIIRLTSSQDNDRAIMQTNGHCYEGGFLKAGQVITGKSSTRSGTVLNADGSKKTTVQADRVLYATMTDTDVAWYRLTETYAQLKEKKVTPLELASTHPAKGTQMDVVSGYWKKIYSCNIDTFVHQLKESEWTWKDSIRYTSACQTIGGTSGSPIVDRNTGKAIGINNTGNESGEKCTLNNPCEVDQSGTVTVHKDSHYGQQTYQLYGCIGAGNAIDPNKAGCTLPKP
ncbi:serine protease [Pseudonocardiaceae bacterium YIM PH 21723]|nr:serine protease [Pseudonocardiaceae bacterium YIM PH 21723]